MLADIQLTDNSIVIFITGQAYRLVLFMKKE